MRIGYRPNLQIFSAPSLAVIVLILLPLAFQKEAVGQAAKMSTILYGASYYHEYMPYERLEKDVQ